MAFLDDLGGHDVAVGGGGVHAGGNGDAVHGAWSSGWYWVVEEAGTGDHHRPSGLVGVARDDTRCHPLRCNILDGIVGGHYGFRAGRHLIMHGDYRFLHGFPLRHPWARLADPGETPSSIG